MHTEITTICRLAIALFLSVLVIFPTSTLANEITGAGATFLYPLYAKWAETYKARTGIGLDSQSIGSGGGIKQIKVSTVDFGASDMPLKPEMVEKKDLMQFPTVVGGVVPVINLRGVAAGAVRLNGTVQAAIFMGKIQKWNGPAIAALNKGLRLPAIAITVVHRSDGSGTTFIFTNYLAKVSPEWKQKVGNTLPWPGPQASAARAMKEWLSSFSAFRDRLAT